MLATDRPKAEHELFKGTKDLADAEVGELIGVIDFVVTRAMVNRTAWAMDDYNPWYMEDSPFGGPIATPTAPLEFDGPMFYDYYKYPTGGSLFAKQEFEFIRPVKVGEPYKLTGRLQSTYRKRGRTYFEMGVSITDSSGTEVIKMVKTIATPVTPVADEETTA
jgi:acyl dehydratase